jgi:hypothetical protein
MKSQSAGDEAQEAVGSVGDLSDLSGQALVGIKADKPHKTAIRTLDGTSVLGAFGQITSCTVCHHHQPMGPEPATDIVHHPDAPVIGAIQPFDAAAEAPGHALAQEGIQQALDKHTAVDAEGGRTTFLGITQLKEGLTTWILTAQKLDGGGFPAKGVQETQTGENELGWILKHEDSAVGGGILSAVVECHRVSGAGEQKGGRSSRDTCSDHCDVDRS